MNALLSPTLAYIVLMLSVFFSLLAILSPGTGMLELLALTGLLFSGYAVYQLGITLWALLLLLLSVVPFILSLRQTGWKRSLSLLGALSGMVIGSLFLFPNAERSFWPPAVDVWVALFFSAFFVLGIWFAARPIRQAMEQRPVHSLEALIGQVGETRTRVHHEGTVQLQGELWSARSQKPIPAGRKVQVTGREGFVLIVEEITGSGNSED
jgi:membrane-bound serine protease (ClpP class)